MSHHQLIVLFCWLYRASPSLAAKNIIDLILDHLVMSMCRAFSCVAGRRHLLLPVCSLGKTLLAFALLHFVLQGQTYLYSRYLLTSYFCILIPYDEKDFFGGFLVLVLEGLIGLHRTIQLQLLWHYWLEIQVKSIDFDYCDIEWFDLFKKIRDTKGNFLLRWAQ